MKITLALLKELNAYKNDIVFFEENYPDGISAKDLILSLCDRNRHDIANWLLGKVLNNQNKMKYAIYAAELALHIFENKYPTDMRPREAINAAKNHLDPDTYALYDDACAARAACVARAAYDAAGAASNQAVRACYAANAASWAAWTIIPDASFAAHYTAFYSALATYNETADPYETYQKIINYGLELLE
jgi:hypothetical protein